MADKKKPERAIETYEERMERLKAESRLEMRAVAYHAAPNQVGDELVDGSPEREAKLELVGRRSTSASG